MRNPELFAKLQAIFGEVRITNEDQAFLSSNSVDVYGKKTLKKIQSGEEYRVCCPMCGDKRFRLYINHTWGMDMIVGFPSSKLVKCQNEDCEQSKEPSRDVGAYLKRYLRGYFRDLQLGKVPPMVNISTTSEVKSDPLPFPTTGIPLNQLSKGNPAYDYLVSRSFSPLAIGDMYGVTYVLNYNVQRDGKDYSWLGGRMFIPCGDGGWQARALNGSTPKYFTATGWQKSKTVYNLATAKQHPDCAILCEGVTDVWRAGSRGLCLFGKSASSAQIDLISRNFECVAVALDTDAYCVKGEAPGSGDKVIENLKAKGVRAFRVFLPEDKDPADCTVEELQQHVTKAATAERIKVKWI